MRYTTLLQEDEISHFAIFCSACSCCSATGAAVSIDLQISPIKMTHLRRFPRPLYSYSSKNMSEVWPLTCFNFSTKLKAEKKRSITDGASALNPPINRKVIVPNINEFRNLLPSANISKDAREIITSIITSRLVYAASVLTIQSEKSRALFVYSVLTEFMRFGYGDVCQGAHTSSGNEMQLVILHEEETEGKEMDNLVTDGAESFRSNVFGGNEELKINFGEEMMIENKSIDTDYVIYGSLKKPQKAVINETIDDNKYNNDDAENNTEDDKKDKKKIRLLVVVKNCLLNESNLVDGHTRIVSQLINGLGGSINRRMNNDMTVGKEYFTQKDGTVDDKKYINATEDISEDLIDHSIVTNDNDNVIEKKRNHHLWGALTDGYDWYFYKIRKNDSPHLSENDKNSKKTSKIIKPVCDASDNDNNNSNGNDEDYRIERSQKIELFDAHIQDGKINADGFGFFFSSLYPNLKNMITEENIRKAEMYYNQKVGVR